MKKLKSIILQMNFRKFFKRFLVVSLAVVILGGILTGISFRTQISEGISYAQMWENDVSGQYEHHDRREFDEFDRYDHIPFTEPSTGAKIVAGIFGCLCFLILAVYWLAVVAWLYKAAVVSGMNRLLWPLAGLIGNLLSVILFLAVRGTIRRKCLACGHWQKKANQYCVDCGTRLREECPACGENCDREERYCHACGHKLYETD